MPIIILPGVVLHCRRLWQLCQSQMQRVFPNPNQPASVWKYWLRTINSIIEKIRHQLVSQYSPVTMCWVYTVLFLSLAVSALAQDCTCRPKSRCVWALASKSKAVGFVCDLPWGREGFCCSDILARPKEVRQSILSFRSFRRRTRTTTVNPTLTRMCC